jgi:hypothetical protein
MPTKAAIMLPSSPRVDRRGLPAVVGTSVAHGSHEGSVMTLLELLALLALATLTVLVIYRVVRPSSG